MFVLMGSYKSSNNSLALAQTKNCRNYLTSKQITETYLKFCVTASNLNKGFEQSSNLSKTAFLNIKETSEDLASSWSLSADTENVAIYSKKTTSPKASNKESEA